MQYLHGQAPLYRDDVRCTASLAAIERYARGGRADSASAPPTSEPEPEVARLWALSRRNIADADVLLGATDGRGHPLRLRDLYVSRTVEDDPLLACREPGATLLVGEAGDGKSSLLWRLAATLDERGTAPLLLRATDLLPPSRDAGPAASPQALRATLSASPPGGPPTVLLDTADLLLQSDDLPAELADVLDVAAEAGAAVVLTCRTREAAVLRRHLEDLRTVQLGPYDRAEMPRAVAAHVRRFVVAGTDDPAALTRHLLAAVTRGLPLADVCRRPLALRMLFELDLLDAPDTPDPSAEIDITDLYDRYWDVRVCDDLRGPRAGSAVDASAAAGLVAVVMLAAGLPVVALRDVRGEMPPRAAAAAEVRGGLEALCRRGVLTVRRPSPLARGDAEHVGTQSSDPVGRVVATTDPDATVAFFHQTLFEYAAARAIAALGDETVAAAVKRVETEPTELFFAAVVQQLLVHQASTRAGADRVDAGLARLLSCGDDRVVQMAVAVYAQARHRGPRAHDAATALLGTTGAGLVRRYLTYLPRVRHASLEQVLTELTTIWQRDLSTEVQVEVLAVLRSLAAAHPHRILAFLLTDAVDWPGWLRELGPAEARRVRAAPLDLISALAPADGPWATARLIELAHLVSVGTATQDALADVLHVAAELTGDRQATLGFLRAVPADVRIDARGIHALTAALSGLQHRLWTHERRSAPDAAREVVTWHRSLRGLGDGAPAVTGVTELRRRADLWALATLVHVRPTELSATLDILLTWDDPMARTDVADWFLRRLIEGARSPALPGGPAPVDGPACDRARTLCAQAIESLIDPAASADPRSDARLWRDALDHAAIGPAEMAAVARHLSSARECAAAWTARSGWAGLLPATALAGFPPAVAALDAWAGRSEPCATKEERDVRRVIAFRLAALAPTTPAAVEYLLTDARVESDGQFVVRAVLHPDGRLRFPLGPLAVPLAELARSLIAGGVDETRRQGYNLLAELGATVSVPPALVIDAVRHERVTGPSRAALNLLDRSLSGLWGPRFWSGSDVEDLDAALEERIRRIVAGGGADSDNSDLHRCWAARGRLHCRFGALTSDDDRSRTLHRARELVLAPMVQADLAPLGYLLDRLADVDPTTGGELLVEASRVVHRMPPGTWKKRRAHRWRAGMIPLLARMPMSTWHATMAGLAHADPGNLGQAVDISMGLPEDRSQVLESLLTDTAVPPEVRAGFHNARQRRQRVSGGARTWMPVLTTWHARHA